MQTATLPGPFRSRRYRWFYWTRNVAVAFIYPTFIGLTAAIASSPRTPTAERLLWVAGTVIVLGGGLWGFFMNVRLRRQADRTTTPRRSAIIYRSAYEFRVGDVSPTDLGRGWLHVRASSLEISRAATSATADTMTIRLDTIRRVERRNVAAASDYPLLAVVLDDAEIIFELPCQNGFTFHGIGDREFRDVVDQLRRAVRAARPTEEDDSRS